VTVSDAVVNQFNELKLHRIPIKFAIYKIDGEHIVGDVESESDSFDEFLQAFPPDDCRYAVYDMNFTTTDGRPGNKLVLVTW
jgi:cofilin